MTKRIHFPLTTASQRRLLFETWQASGNVTLACRTAHVGRRTFYYWKPRFDAGGYAALSQFASAARKQPHGTEKALEQQGIAMRHAHPEWCKVRLAHELAKAHHWQPLVSPNTVKRILRSAGLWSAPAVPEKKGASQPSHARPKKGAKP